MARKKAAAASSADLFYVGYSLTGRPRQRDGIQFFAVPHVYPGKPTRAMAEDRFLHVDDCGDGSVAAVRERYPEAPAASKGVERLVAVHGSEYYGAPEATLREAARERRLEGVERLDYDGLVGALMDSDPKPGQAEPRPRSAEGQAGDQAEGQAGAQG